MNELKVNQQNAIIALHRQGWSKRKIARELGVDRSAVRRYLAASADSKPPINPRTGSEGQTRSAADAVPAPSACPGEAVPPKPLTNPRTGLPAETSAKAGVLALGGAGPDSLCEPWKDHIQSALAAGLS